MSVGSASPLVRVVLPDLRLAWRGPHGRTRPHLRVRTWDRSTKNSQVGRCGGGPKRAEASGAGPHGTKGEVEVCRGVVPAAKVAGIPLSRTFLPAASAAIHPPRGDEVGHAVTRPLHLHHRNQTRAQSGASCFRITRGFSMNTTGMHWRHAWHTSMFPLSPGWNALTRMPPVRLNRIVFANLIWPLSSH